MLTFNEFVSDIDNACFLTEALINKHSTHIEELIFTDGKQGLNHAVEGLQYIVNTIGSHTNSVSTKIDGCVHKDTLVLTMKGSKRISELTNKDFVGCFDVVRNKVVYVDNTRPRITPGDKDWVQVIVDNRGTVKCTKDHQWLSAHKQYIEASNITHRSVYCINNEQKRMFVHNVTPLKQKYDQWDLTTRYHNFIINVNGAYLVIHNSPAVFLCNGEDGFAVASKSIFNKNPKLNYTEKDIDTNHSGGLAAKLKASLKYLSKVVPNTKNKVWQGDLLFTPEDLKTYQKDGKNLLGFQPNTIVYTVDANSELAKRIKRSKIGIAVHTEYDWDGKDPTTLNVSKFGISADDFKDNNDVFLIDTIVRDQSGTKVSFSKQESAEIDNAFKRVKTVGNAIDWSIMSTDLASHLQTYINTFIRDNTKMIPPKQRAEKFFEWIEKNVEKQKSTRKTQRGKDAVDKRYQGIRATKRQIADIIRLFDIFDDLTSIKLKIVDKLNAMSQYGHFIIKSNGDMQATGDEGFVLTSTGAKGAKLVDRYAFSVNNFSKDIIRSWTHTNDQ